MFRQRSDIIIQSDVLFKVFRFYFCRTVTVTASVIIPRPEHSCDSYKIINTNIKHLQHLQFLGNLKSPGPWSIDAFYAVG